MCSTKVSYQYDLLLLLQLQSIVRL